jgi:hypothetical protein
MGQIVVQIMDKEKAKVLLELLTALDFVDSVQTMETDQTVGSNSRKLFKVSPGVVLG